MTTPSGLPRGARATWEALDTATVAAGAGATFDPASASTLPEPVARWLRHVIEPGTPLRRGVRVSMRGEILLGSWRAFTADQILSPGGFVWAARAGSVPMRVSGFDRYRSGVGEMRWKLLGLVPVMRASGPDTSRSAAGRFAGESLVLTPAGAVDATWRSDVPDTAIATVVDGSYSHDVELVVDEDGVARSVSFGRWGDPDGAFAEHTFGVEFDGELSADGYRIPATMRAGWWYGSDRWSEGEFFRATIEHAEFF